MVNLVRLPGTRLFLPQFNVSSPEEARVGFVLWDEDLQVEQLSLETAIPSGALAIWPERKQGGAAWRKLGQEVWQRLSDRRRAGQSKWEPKVGWFDLDGKPLSRWIDVNLPANSNGTYSLNGTVGLYIGDRSYALKLKNNADIKTDARGLVIAADSTYPHRVDIKPEDSGGVDELDILGDVVLSLDTPESAGTIKFDTILDDDSITKLRMQLRFYGIEDIDGFPIPIREVTNSRYSIFTFEGNLADEVPLAAQIDLLHPYEKQHTHFIFNNAQAHGQTPASEAIQSFFDTELGHPVGLIPIEGACLVITRQYHQYDISTGNLDESRNYLVPDGPFEFYIEGDDGSVGWPEEHVLFTGASKTEFIPFVPRRNGISGNVMTFHSGQPAIDLRKNYKPEDDPSLLYDSDASTEALLHSAITTSYISVSTVLGPKTKGASRQPERSTLHGVKKIGDSMANDSIPAGNFLDFQPERVVHNVPIPAVPLLGLDKTPDPSAKSLKRDREILANVRSQLLKREKISAAPIGQPMVADSSNEFENVFTPQGFEVRKSGGSWKELVLAKCDDGNTKDLELKLIDLDPILVDVLIRNKMFVVLPSLSTSAGNALAKLEGSVVIQGWRFSFELPSEWDDMPLTSGSALPKPLLIIKQQDRSIEDLVNDPTVWSNRSFLTRSAISDLKNQLKLYISDAKEKAGKENRGGDAKVGLYAGIVDRMTDPDWNGFLLINLKIDLGKIPLQIKGMLGGIDLSRFNAHHVGISLNRLKPGDAHGPEVAKSALFGLIDYPLPQFSQGEIKFPDISADESYDFKVERMAILFDNAEIKRFDCRVNVFIGELFYEKVVPEPGKPATKPPGRIIDIDGRFESRMVGNEIVDTYSFVHEETYNIKLSTCIFETITIKKIQFTTVSATPISEGGKQGQKIDTRFAVWGTIEFKDLTEFARDFDLLSINRMELSDLGIAFEVKMFEEASGLPLKLPRFDLGNVRFDLPEGGKRDGGLLKNLPFRFKFFQFAGKGNLVNLAQEGYFGLPIKSADTFKFGLGFDVNLGSLGGLSSKTGGLNLTALIGWMPGKGSSTPQFCVGFRFENSGGSKLNIGIEGVLRLTAEEFDFGKATGKLRDGTSQTYFMIKLLKCRLQVGDYTIPQEAKFNLFLFADPGNLSADKIGWYGSLANPKVVDGLDIEYIGMGQRVHLSTNSQSSTQTILNGITTIGVVDSEGSAAKQIAAGKISYDPDRDWTVALRALVFEVFDLDLLFMDPDTYGARVRAPSRKSSAPLLFDVDILYRKITDDLGVYSMEIVLSDSIRQIELGAASLTLPAIGLEFWTDGGFTIDLGYPGPGLDFSRSFTVQVLPFLGAGGVVYSRVNGLGSDRIPKPVSETNCIYHPVVRVAFGGRFGLGKEIQKGALRAGLSITVYGLLEGIWGELRKINSTLPVPADKEPPKSYVIVAGEYGVIAEIFGYVDFGIVKAGVAIRVTVGIGVVFETWKSTLLYAQAQVSVRVTVVIASFKIFGKRITIKASFSFSTGLRYEWRVGTDDSRRAIIFDSPLADATSMGLLPSLDEDDTAGDVISWDPSLVLFTSKKPLSIWFTPEVALDYDEKDDDTKPSLVMLFAVEGGPSAGGTPGTCPFDLVIRALTAWAVHERFKKDPGRDSARLFDWVLDEADLLRLTKSLAQPFNLSRGDGSGTPLDYQTLTSFIKGNFAVTLCEHPVATADESVGGALFPSPAELILNTTYNGEPQPDRPFEDFPRADDTYERKLEEFFEQLMILIDQRKPKSDMADDAIGTERLIVEILFEDYFALIIKSAAQELLETLRRKERDSQSAVQHTLTSLLDAMAEDKDGTSEEKQDAYSRISAMAGHYVMHGLRLPERDEINITTARTNPFFKAAGLQRSLRETAWPDPLPRDFSYEVSLTGAGDDAARWFTVSNGTLPPSKLDLSVLQAISGANIRPQISDIQLVDEVRTSIKNYLFSDAARLLIKSNGVQSPVATLWSVPEDLRVTLRRRQVEGQGPLSLEPFVQVRENEDTRREAVEDWQWAARIPVTVRRIPADVGGFQPNTYELIGLTEANRRILDRLVTDTVGNWKPSFHEVDVRVFQPVFDDANGERIPGHLVRGSVNQKASFVFRTNLSNVPTPHGVTGTSDYLHDDASNFFSGNFSDAERPQLIELIRQGSVINSGGYYIRYEDGTGKGFDERLFDSVENKGEIVILLRFNRKDSPAFDYANCLYIPDDKNAAVVAAAEETTGNSLNSLFAQSPETIANTGLQPGTLGFQVFRKAPSTRYRSLLHPERGSTLTRVQVEAEFAAAAHDPTDMDALEKYLKAAGAIEVELEERYNLLEFEISGPGLEARTYDTVLPIGPKIIENETLTPPYGPGDWKYEQNLPVYKLSSDNASNGIVSGDNWYSSVGKKLHLKIGFRDIFGNRLKQSGGSADLEIGYFDPLMTPTNWPGVTCSYGWGVPGSKEVILSFMFDPKAYMRGPERDIAYDPLDPSEENRALRDRIEDGRKALYKALQQLNDSNVWIEADVTLRSEGNVKLTRTSPTFTNLLKFLEDIDKELQHALKPGDEKQCDKKPCAVDAWSWTIKVDNPDPSPFIEMAVGFEIRRPVDKDKVADSAKNADFRAVWEGKLEVAAQITLNDSKEKDSPTFTFAKAFEEAFPDCKLAAGVGRERSHAYWIVKTEMIDAKVDWDEAEDQPVIYAIPPLSTSLESGQFPFPDPTLDANAEPSKINVRDVDIDVRMREFVRDLERFLSPEFSVVARSLRPTEVDTILRSKNKIAGLFADRLATVYDDPRASLKSEALPSAASVFVDRMRIDSRSAYDVDSVLAYPMKFSSDAANVKPSIFGKVKIAGTQDDSSSGNEGPPYIFHPVKMTLDADAPYLVALFDSKREKEDKAPKLKPSLTVTHVERKFGPQDYRPKAWLQLLVEHQINLTPPTSDGFEIPVPLREYPLPPTLVRQHDSPTYSANELPQSGFADWCSLAQQWNLDVYYSIVPVDQDLIYATVTYNNVDPRKIKRAAQDASVDSFSPDLVQALLIYGELREKVWNVIQGLRNGGAGGDPRSVEWFSTLCNWVVGGFERWGELAADALPITEDRVWVDEIFSNDSGTHEIKLKRLSGLIADRVIIAPTMPNGSVIEHTPLPGNGGDTNCGDNGKACYSIRYEPPIGQATDGTKWCHRKLSFTELRIAEIENGWAGIELTRNEDLYKGPSKSIVTNPAFIYRTSLIRFGGHRTPSLERISPIDISDGEKRSMADHVSVLLKNILGVNGKNPYNRTAVEFDIGWGYDNERLQAQLHDDDRKVVNSLVPFPKKRIVANTIAIDSKDDSPDLDGFINSVATRLDNWHSASIFAKDSMGQPIGSIVFDVTLYAHIKGEDKPTFRALNCRLPLKNINKNSGT